MNVNLSAEKFSHGLLWHTNYAINTKYYLGSIAAADTSSRFDNAIYTDSVTGEWCDEAKAIIANAGIEEEYKDNFSKGLQKIEVINELKLNIGETFSNVPRLVTSKRSTYKNNELSYMVYSSNSSVATVSDEGIITAKSAGAAKIIYTVIENGTMYKSESNVIVSPGTIELENCHDNSLKINQTLSVASGEKYIWGYADVDLSASVTIPVSGYYTVAYAVGRQLNEYVSPVTFKLGDTVIGQNDADYVHDLYGANTFSYEHAPMSVYRRKVWLEAGTYDLTVDIGITQDKRYKYQMDYIKIEF